jgi:hypothetical protein
VSIALREIPAMFISFHQADRPLPAGRPTRADADQGRTMARGVCADYSDEDISSKRSELSKRKTRLPLIRTSLLSRALDR